MNINCIYLISDVFCLSYIIYPSYVPAGDQIAVNISNSNLSASSNIFVSLRDNAIGVPMGQGPRALTGDCIHQPHFSQL